MSAKGGRITKNPFVEEYKGSGGGGLVLLTGSLLPYFKPAFHWKAVGLTVKLNIPGGGGGGRST